MFGGEQQKRILCEFFFFGCDVGKLLGFTFAIKCRKSSEIVEKDYAFQGSPFLSELVD